MIGTFLRDFRAAMAARQWDGVTGAARLTGHYLFRTWMANQLLTIAPYGLTIPLHRARGVTIGRDCFIDSTAILETSHADRIFIGNDVRITARCIVMAHIVASEALRSSGAVPRTISRVVIEDHAFIGVNAVILPGVRVGEGAVVAGGAVVFSNVPEYTLVAGNPAKVVRKLSGSVASESGDPTSS